MSATATGRISQWLLPAQPDYALGGFGASRATHIRERSGRRSCPATNAGKRSWMRRYAKYFFWLVSRRRRVVRPWPGLDRGGERGHGECSSQGVGSVGQFHRRKLSDSYHYLIFDGVSACDSRLVGEVQRRVALCAYGINQQGQGELIDFFLVKAEGEESWTSLLLDLWNRGLKGASLQLIVSDGHAGLIKALGCVWPRMALQRCWAAQAAQLTKPAPGGAASLPGASQTHLPDAE